MVTSIKLTERQFKILILLQIIFDPKHDFTHARILGDYLKTLRDLVMKPDMAIHKDKLDITIKIIKDIYDKVIELLQNLGYGCPCKL